jgi:hypothetical protein
MSKYPGARLARRSKTCADGETGKRPVSPQSNSTDPCPYEILKKWHFGNVGTFFDAAPAFASISLSLRCGDEKD